MNLKFPTNKRAKESTLHEQLNKVLEEATESLNAYLDGEGDARICEELIDTYHAVEGALAKFPQSQVTNAYTYVLVKNSANGDYSDK